jgi:hypothetical protein
VGRINRIQRLTRLRGIGGGAAAAWSPLTSPAVLEYWTFDDLTPGVIGSWVGKKGLCTLASAGAARPTANATTFNGTPGLVCAGAQGMSGAIDLSSHSTLRIVCGLVDATAALGIVWEYTTNGGTTNGGLYQAVNNAGAFECNLRQTGSGTRMTTESLATAGIMSVGYDFSLDYGIRFVRKASAAQSMTNFANGCVAGNFANSTFNIMSRVGDGSSLPWSGKMGGGLLLMSGIAEDADLLAAEAWAAARAAL